MMNKLDKVIQERAPLIFNDNLTGKTLKLLLNRLFKYEETKNTLRLINNLPFNDVFSWLSKQYTPNVTILGKQHIPKDTPALLVSNHPMGPADAIALIGNLVDVRNDIYIFANKIFIDLIEDLDNCIAPLSWDQNKETHIANKRTITKMITFIHSGMLGLYFPSGRIAKYGILKTKDYVWNETPLNIAERYNLEIIPVYINSKNSIIFYLSRLIHKNLRDISQIYELLNKKSRHIRISIGSGLERTDLSKNNSIAIKELREIVEKLR